MDSLNVFRRKVELYFFGDEKLVFRAQNLLKDPPRTATQMRHSILVGGCSVIATFNHGYNVVQLHAVPKHATSLIVVLYDINTNNPDICIPKEFINEVCTFGESSVLWVTGIWNADSVSNASGPPSNLNQRRQELELRNDTLKFSLKRGARYARWSGSAELESLHTPIKELVDNKHSKSNFARSIDPKLFVFTDAATGMEINDPLELSEEDFIIAVMGPTGAGKSTFIKNATGYNPAIGDDLELCTSEIHIIRVQSGDSKIYIVDTPGFNDTNKSDLEIFKLISEWLRQRFTNQVYLAGLIYLHRISDNRMGRTTLKNLKIFEKPCGKDCFHKITLATTMWDDVETEEFGAFREKELKRDYFSMMLARGADYKRLGHSQTSARDLLDSIIDRARELRPLSLQKELVAYQKDLPHTNAGRKMYSKLNEVLQSRQDALAQLNRDLRAGKSPRVHAIPSKELQELTQELTVLIADMQYMQLSLPARIAQLVTGWMLLSPRPETAIENPQSEDKSTSNLETEKQEMKSVSTTNSISMVGTSVSQSSSCSSSAIEDDVFPSDETLGPAFELMEQKWIRETRRSLPNLLNEDGVVGVVGSIGSGKSMFVNSVTGSSLKVGHDLKPCTSAICVVCFQHDNGRIYVVDTPEFNDEDRTDADTCDLISEWYKKCVPEINFAGIVYLHSINAGGVKGNWLENLKFFQQLCSGNYHKVTFATTMWDDGQDINSTGTHKEEFALKEYFAHIFSGGAQLKRLDSSPKSAKALLTGIIRDSRDLQAVDVQKQLVADHKDLAEGKISTEMDAKLIRVVGAHKETLVRLSLEKRVEHSEHVQRILHKEYTKLADELEGVVAKLKARSA